jgi:site-specific DNA-cytosine methylase
MMHIRTIRHGHLFCGLGGGARGFNRSAARVGTLVARMECAGGIDVDAAAISDFGRLAGIAGTVLDLFSREQYVAFHGRQPPPGWREAIPADIRTAMRARPHIWFLSAPCKGFSGLTSEAKSLTPKYQALNELTLRGIWLALEAYADDPVEFILFENVPRIASRGAHLLEQIKQLLQHYGYAVSMAPHNCGNLGGLAQSRPRFLLVARHTAKVPPFLYQPPWKPLRGVGEVLGKLPIPGTVGLPLHRLPNLQWKTWVRLAFVEAGKDWRSLQRLAVEDGFLRDYGVVPVQDHRNGFLGVHGWQDASGVIAGESLPNNGAFAVADPRIDGHEKSVQTGVRRWDQTAGVVTGKMLVGGGPHAVADPRVDGVRHNNVFRVVRFDEPSPAITAGGHPTAGGLGVADPRCTHADSAHHNKYRVTDWKQTAGSVIGATRPGSGAGSVADPRPGLQRDPGDAYRTSGHYGVIPWDRPAYAVTGAQQHDNGRGNVADPRVPPPPICPRCGAKAIEAGVASPGPVCAGCGSWPFNEELPAPNDKLACVIIAEDGTWHRPFTTLDMAALQSLLDPEEYMHFQLEGRSDSAIRERIGNAVPSDAAEAIGSVIARTLLLAWSGETFVLSSEPIWVREQIAAIQCGSTV